MSNSLNKVIDIDQLCEEQPSLEEIKKCTQKLSLSFHQQKLLNIFHHLYKKIIDSKPIINSQTSVNKLKLSQQSLKKQKEIKMIKMIKNESQDQSSHYDQISICDRNQYQIDKKKATRNGALTIKGQNQQNLRKVSEWIFQNQNNKEHRLYVNKVAPRFRNKDQQSKFYQKRLIAKAFTEKQYGLTQLKQDYLDCISTTRKSYYATPCAPINKCQIPNVDRIASLRPSNLGYNSEKPKYKTIAIAFITDVYRKFQGFIMDQIDKRIRAIIGPQMKALVPVLLHAQINFSDSEYQTFRKMVKYTFDLGSVSIYSLSAKILYQSIQLLLKAQINGETTTNYEQLHYKRFKEDIQKQNIICNNKSVVCIESQDDIKSIEDELGQIEAILNLQDECLINQSKSYQQEQGLLQPINMAFIFDSYAIKIYLIAQCLWIRIIIILMSQQAKLVVAQTLQGEEEYFIFSNIILGEGGYGKVKKATNKDKTRQLAVKIIPYDGDQIKRKKVEKQINILRILPENKHLVRVLPIKCFSQNNFYIFMQLCKDGTLIDYLKDPAFLTEEKIFDIFWQLMNGYRVLWQNKIVHQDLKLANVLIKNGVLKITDFGFSILTQNYVPSLTREGSLQYMSLQKLTSASYIADEKTDIYSLGIMMFELITKKHPYINHKCKSNKEYALQLYKSQLVLPQNLNKFSAPMQGLLDVIIKMIAKKLQNRLLCQQIYDYIDHQEIFSTYREKYANQSKQISLQPQKMIITDKTDVIVVPFPIQLEKENQYVSYIKDHFQIKRNQQNQKIITKIQHWILNLRLAVYFFDRLARRLFIEKLRGNFSSQKLHCYNKMILSCFLAGAKITKWILQQIRYPSNFSQDQINIFRRSSQGNQVIKIIRRDQEYIREQITDNLKKTNQIQFKQQKTLIDLAEKDQFVKFIETVIPIFEDCMQQKANYISNRKDLITISYIIDGIKILRPLPQSYAKLQLQHYFYQNQTKDTIELYKAIDKYFKENKIQTNIDEQICSQEGSFIKQ